MKLYGIIKENIKIFGRKRGLKLKDIADSIRMSPNDFHLRLRGGERQLRVKDQVLKVKPYQLLMPPE